MFFFFFVMEKQEEKENTISILFLFLKNTENMKNPKFRAKVMFLENTRFLIIPKL